MKAGLAQYTDLIGERVDWCPARAHSPVPDDVRIPVKILDVAPRFGRVDYLIEIHGGGEGQRWVQAGNLYGLPDG